MVSASNTDPRLTDPDTAAGGLWQPGYYRTAHNDIFQGRIAAEFLYNELGKRKLATIHDGSTYADSLQAVAADVFQELGGEVVFQGAVNVGDTDMRPILTEVGTDRAGCALLPHLRAGRQPDRGPILGSLRSGGHDADGRRRPVWSMASRKTPVPPPLACTSPSPCDRRALRSRSWPSGTTSSAARRPAASTPSPMTAPTDHRTPLRRWHRSARWHYPRWSPGPARCDVCHIRLRRSDRQPDLHADRRLRHRRSVGRLSPHRGRTEWQLAAGPGVAVRQPIRHCIRQPFSSCVRDG